MRFNIDALSTSIDAAEIVSTQKAQTAKRCKKAASTTSSIHRDILP